MSNLLFTITREAKIEHETYIEYSEVKIYPIMEYKSEKRALERFALLPSDYGFRWVLTKITIEKNGKTYDIIKIKGE